MILLQCICEFENYRKELQYFLDQNSMFLLSSAKTSPPQKCNANAQ